MIESIYLFHVVKVRVNVFTGYNIPYLGLVAIIQSTHAYHHCQVEILIKYIKRAKGCCPSLRLRFVFLSRSSATVVVARTRARQILRVPVIVRLPGAGSATLIAHPSRGNR